VAAARAFKFTSCYTFPFSSQFRNAGINPGLWFWEENGAVSRHVTITHHHLIAQKRTQGFKLWNAFQPLYVKGVELFPAADIRVF